MWKGSREGGIGWFVGIAKTARKGLVECASDKTRVSKLLWVSGSTGKVKITLPCVKDGSCMSKPPSTCGDRCSQGRRCQR